MRCNDIIVIVMAAGQSSRFGSDKRAAKLSSGETLLDATLLSIQKHFSNICVVIKPEDNIESFGLSIQPSTIISPRSHLGLGYSISDAFLQLMQDKRTHDENIQHYRAAAIWLADLPWVSQNTCEVVTNITTAENIVQPLHFKKPGHPVVFGNKFWHELAHLENAKGASTLVKKHSSHVINVSLNDPGVCADVDYPDDLIEPLKSTRDT
ncbi:nucleotidyltransferase family protein [Halomonas sp. ISL-60]|uniref:nucleotidyltransferase family protein n=1 Tax=Halomonas sp. ISL-56 TaxID=2819149 RepID=UPI001BED058D|nr:nucleotidyltransferase family protein [Halomonas sp. ISL-56]MBT2772584.1 nucleotidyltransferase family protein [Halomonas sp. ISL-60]MBT2801208.1 nucleotidyltransferase family protein [Halomonas sp. ISL-56]